MPASTPTQTLPNGSQLLLVPDKVLKDRGRVVACSLSAFPMDCRCFGAAGLRLAEPGLLGLGVWQDIQVCEGH